MTAFFLPLAAGQTPGEAMVRFLDGTWCLCRVGAWRRDLSGEWRVRLRWGALGDVYSEWHLFDAGPVSSAEGAPNPP
ncbi:hypothetical protein [Trebonia sp.]|uniref:hypothetical protein n=1 Tax=Trebonia sp. TaxID=2767075 RepID=UPI002630626F|nr:hypothetical protein [Trebonia sp.]